jgi:hypothetical protein
LDHGQAGRQCREVDDEDRINNHYLMHLIGLLCEIRTTIDPN